MRLRRNAPGVWQATTMRVMATDGYTYRAVTTTGSLTYVLYWHPRCVRQLRNRSQLKPPRGRPEFPR